MVVTAKRVFTTEKGQLSLCWNIDELFPGGEMCKVTTAACCNHHQELFILVRHSVTHLGVYAVTLQGRLLYTVWDGEEVTMRDHASKVYLQVCHELLLFQVAHLLHVFRLRYE